MNEIQFCEAKDKFVQSWGNMATNWGVSKTMGMIHALLLVSEKPLCVEEITSQLGISKSNLNLNIRTLIDWGIVYKQCGCGERREFYTAEKNLWKVFILIIEQRKKKELDPMIQLLEEMIQLHPSCPQSSEFHNTVKELTHFSKKADLALDNIIKSESSFLMQSFIKMIR